MGFYLGGASADEPESFENRGFTLPEASTQRREKVKCEPKS